MEDTRLVLLGPPASGKGTVGRMLRDQYGLAYLSTGRQLRREVRAGTALGEEVDRYLSSNEYVPDRLALRLVEDWLGEVDGGWVLDGFPRTLAQAGELDRFPEQIVSGMKALVLEVPVERLEQRVTGRRECSSCAWSGPLALAAGEERCPECGRGLVQRHDDTPKSFRQRMAVYEELSGPLVDFYASSGRLLSVSGVGTPEEVFKGVQEALRDDG